MAKIIKIEDKTIFIGADNGKLIEVQCGDCTFQPAVGIEVEVYSNEKRTIVIQKEPSKAIIPVNKDIEINKPIIYYGISESMKKSFNDFVKKTGEPKLIVEKEENLSKYKGKLFDKYEIVSLDKALELYPDATVWVTYEVANDVANRIAKKIDPSRINFFKANLEYRKGCKLLGRFMDYRVDNFSPCCIGGPVEKTSGTIPERIAHWERYVNKLVDELKNNQPNKCTNCHLLKEGFWPKKPALNYVCFSTSHPGDVCNLKCSYCFVEKKFEKLNGKNAAGYTTYETIKQLSQMPEYNRSNMTIELSNGEFCANKYCDEIFDILLNNSWKVRFVTNMTIYREKFAEFLKTGRTVNVLTSLDAGTRETYKAIKKVDCLDKVIENMKKYPLKDVDFQLKYIFLEGVNDNEADVNGFYNIVKDVECKKIALSSNKRTPYSDNIKNLVTELAKKAKQDGIKIIKSDYLAPADRVFIDNLVSGK